MGYLNQNGTQKLGTPWSHLQYSTGKTFCFVEFRWVQKGVFPDISTCDTHWLRSCFWGNYHFNTRKSASFHGTASGIDQKADEEILLGKCCHCFISTLPYFVMAST